MISRPVKTRISIEDYLAIEQEDKQKYEYHNGEIFAMAGGSIPHGLIGGNLFASIWGNSEVRKRDCTPYNSDIKIEIIKERRYVYSDSFIVCGPPDISKEIKGAILNPKVIFEVVSDSSVQYDHGDKFRAYRSLRSLREYVVVDQHQPAIVVYRRDSPQMIFQRFDFEGMDAELELVSIGAKIPFSVIYQSVEF